MLIVLEGLFLNVCIIIALASFYLQLKWNKLDCYATNKTVEWIDGLAGGVMGSVLIYFSIHITDQTIVDLRFVPVLLLSLFGSMRSSVISAMIIIAVRFLYGFNSSSLTALLLMLLLIAGFHSINKKMYKESMFKRLFAMICFSNLVFAALITNLLRDAELLRTLIPTYWIISFIGAYSAAGVVNYLKKSHDLFQTYKQQSTIDFLTGLNNVRHFDQLWNQSITVAVEKQESISLLLIDIDFFKRVNDTYGHASGDAVLQQLGRILKVHTRSFDIVSRNGGEEFSVILRDCNPRVALEIAERIRRAVEEFPFELPKSKQVLHITISIGLCTYPDLNNELESIIEKADQSLYKAKRSGRNKVVSC